MKDLIVDIFSCVFVVIVIGGLILLFAAVLNDYKTPNDYAYVDLDGNAGSADYCTSSRAGMWCRAGDRKVMVKEYSYQEEEE